MIADEGIAFSNVTSFFSVSILEIWLSLSHTEDAPEAVIFPL